MSTPTSTAQTLRDSWKRQASRAFDRAIRACGYSNEAVASVLGVSQTRVRRLRSDDPADLDVVPSVADLLGADHDLGERFLVELRAERLALHGAPPAVTLEQQAMAVMALDAEVSRSVATAMRDGVIDPTERTVIGCALLESNRERERLLATVRGKP